MTDYRTMSGADFQREVGTDPEKWAEAAMQDANEKGFKVGRDWIRVWIGDAIEAGRKSSIREVIEGDS